MFIKNHVIISGYILQMDDILNISLCCVCRNEVVTIREAIESAIHKVKQIVVVDHYSYDGTPDVLL
jgi:glycosyltransferase involved in cell wall biosynthesis